MSFGNVEEHLADYLLDFNMRAIKEQLKSFQNGNYYSDYPKDEYLQGDIWAGFDVISWRTGERCKVIGIALSNSCDISEENVRMMPPRIVFAPIIFLDDYIERLKQGGIADSQINNHVQTIKDQEITNLFFLPAGAGIEHDSIVNLHDLHNQRARGFFSGSDAKRIARLSHLGHYLFLFKISIHFCRFGEGVQRNGR